MTTEKQKKEAVFAVIAKLESQGRKINADLVAQHAGMGKQTVLPFYNEWRYLKKMEVYNQEDLPEELMRAIKQHMGKWKYEYEHRFFEQIEALNKDITEAEYRLEDSVTDNKKIQQQLENQDNKIKQQEHIIQNLKSDSQNLQRTIKELEAKLNFEQEQNEKKSAAIKAQKQNYDLELQELEKKLDFHYQQHLDHWIKTTDYEKQERNKLEKKLANKTEEAEKLQITSLNQTAKLNKLKTMLTDSENINQEQQQKIIKLTDNNDKLEQISLLLDCQTTDLIKNIRQLMEDKIELKHCKANNSNLLKQIEKSQKAVNTKKKIKKQEYSL